MQPHKKTPQQTFHDRLCDCVQIMSSRHLSTTLYVLLWHLQLIRNHNMYLCEHIDVLKLWASQVLSVTLLKVNPVGSLVASSAARVNKRKSRGFCTENIEGCRNTSISSIKREKESERKSKIKHISVNQLPFIKLLYNCHISWNQYSGIISESKPKPEPPCAYVIGRRWVK